MLYPMNIIKHSKMHLQAATKPIFRYSFALASMNTALNKIKSLETVICIQEQNSHRAGKRFNVLGINKIPKCIIKMLVVQYLLLLIDYWNMKYCISISSSFSHEQSTKIKGKSQALKEDLGLFHPQEIFLEM